MRRFSEACWHPSYQNDIQRDPRADSLYFHTVCAMQTRQKLPVYKRLQLPDSRPLRAGLAVGEAASSLCTFLSISACCCAVAFLPLFVLAAALLRSSCQASQPCCSMFTGTPWKVVRMRRGYGRAYFQPQTLFGCGELFGTGACCHTYAILACFGKICARKWLNQLDSGVHMHVSLSHSDKCCPLTLFV